MMPDGRPVETGDTYDDLVRVKTWLVFAVTAAVLLLAALILVARPIRASDGSSCGLAFMGFLPVDPGPSGADAAFNECKERTFTAAGEAFLVGAAGGAIAIAALVLRLRSRPWHRALPPRL
jgi:hypothetical protein